MKIDYKIRANAPGLPLIAAAPIQLTVTPGEVEAPGFSYDPTTQTTLGAMGSSYCNIDESIGVPFNSSADSKQDD